MLLYRDISSGDDSTARCVFGCLAELASVELSGLFLLLLAMLTTVVLEAESSVVRDTVTAGTGCASKAHTAAGVSGIGQLGPRLPTQAG